MRWSCFMTWSKFTPRPPRELVRDVRGKNELDVLGLCLAWFAVGLGKRRKWLAELML